MKEQELQKYNSIPKTGGQVFYIEAFYHETRFVGVMSSRSETYKLIVEAPSSEDASLLAEHFLIQKHELYKGTFKFNISLSLASENPLGETKVRSSVSISP